MIKDQTPVKESIRDNSILIKRKDGSISAKLLRYTKTVTYDISLQEGGRFNCGDDEYEVVDVFGVLTDVKKIGTEEIKLIYRDGSDIEETLKGEE